jgi:hypothetical protein
MKPTLTDTVLSRIDRYSIFSSDKVPDLCMVKYKEL